MEELGQRKLVHDFSADLALSRSFSRAPWWEECYRKAFPGFESMEYVELDVKKQRAGIDRKIVTCNAGVRRITCVDEKVRTKDWDDFLLETHSVVEQNKPGWIRKPLACDYIAYAFIPSRRCYLLPVPALQRAWSEHGSFWADSYGHRDALNQGYTTRSVPVPIDQVMLAVGMACLVRWNA